MSDITRREFVGRIGLTAGGLLVLQAGAIAQSEPNASRARAPHAASGEHALAEFTSPPFDCGPWVYWFWLDVNVTRKGITADLEAMKAVGIAGVLIMDVNQGTPASFNGAKFGDPTWYELFQFACTEAQRLGMQINMSNDAGWCGSGGPWITPELSMQRVVWSSTSADGGTHFDAELPQPQANLNFYRDIAVVAFPTPTEKYLIANLKHESDETSEDNIPVPAQWPTLEPGAVVSGKSVLDLSDRMEKTGRLTWDVPPGQWTILRLGHTTTGVLNHPAPAGGLGLETDKLSRQATIVQFDALMGRIVEMIGPLTGKTLVSTHIDSWETGSQNWTPTFAADFKRLRGYDLLPYLPVFTGQVIDGLEVSERFLWDLRKTVGELLTENYAVAMRDVAQKHGLRLSIEGYAGEPDSNLVYGGQADEPMSECWSWVRYGASETVGEMTSAGHVYGRNIIGQETFTADSHEKWLGHPAVVKDIGDWTFSEGINRFVFHRYAMQPWTNPHYAPGMSMGPWGLHYERTQTWWDMSRPWHEYLARCCYMLRQGHFVADVCYMQAEGDPQRFSPPDSHPGNPPRRPGYNYDACPPELVLAAMEFKDGFLTLPGGMKYRVLVLPDSPTITPQLLQKIQTLVEAGAMVTGPRPQKSPSLSDYPHCDDEVQRLAEALWGGGKITGKSPAQLLADRGVKPDFACDQPMVRWTHRRAEGFDIYFVANGAAAADYPYAGSPMVANCSFRIADTKPEIWNPETGRISPVALYDSSDGITRIPIVLPAKGAVFVVFRHGQSPSPAQTLRSVSRNGETLLTAGDGVAISASGKTPPVSLEARADGGLQLCATEPGDYRCEWSSGKAATVTIPDLPEPIALQGPWTVKFPSDWGAPAQIQLEKLIAWNQHSDAGVRYFSGTASYHGEFDVPQELLNGRDRIELDLGEVAVMADVTLNGRRLGTLWKPPFLLDVTSALRAGHNALEIALANLWVNRLIGDQQLPPDAERAPDGHLLSWPQWLLEGKRSPTGRFTFTTWELWRKADPLVESGLIGPVQLRTVMCKHIRG